MDTQIVVNSYKRILLSNEEDESQKLCPEWKQLNMRVGSVWFHLCEVLKQVKLIYGGGGVGGMRQPLSLVRAEDGREVSKLTKKGDERTF